MNSASGGMNSACFLHFFSQGIQECRLHRELCFVIVPDAHAVTA